MSISQIWKHGKTQHVKEETESIFIPSTSHRSESWFSK